MERYNAKFAWRRINNTKQRNAGGTRKCFSSRRPTKMQQTTMRNDLVVQQLETIIRNGVKQCPTVGEGLTTNGNAVTS